MSIPSKEMLALASIRAAYQRVEQLLGADPDGAPPEAWDAATEVWVEAGGQLIDVEHQKRQGVCHGS